MRKAMEAMSPGTAEASDHGALSVKPSRSSAETLMKDFAGKVAFITGGCSGIGYALAEAFGRRGMKVMIADIDENKLSSAVEQPAGKGDRRRGRSL